MPTGVCMHSAQTATRTKGDDGNRRARLGRAICVRAAFLALVVFVLDGQAAPFGSVRGAVSLPSDEISPAERARIKAAIAANVASLQRAGVLPTATAPAGVPAVQFQWPLQLVPGHPEHVARTVLNFVDHDPVSEPTSRLLLWYPDL